MYLLYIFYEKSLKKKKKTIIRRLYVGLASSCDIINLIITGALEETSRKCDDDYAKPTSRGRRSFLIDGKSFSSKAVARSISSAFFSVHPARPEIIAGGFVPKKDVDEQRTEEERVRRGCRKKNI